MEINQDSLWVAKGDMKVVEPVKLSDWECELFGMGQAGIKVIPAVGNVPNCFWRWCQYIAFGNRWRRRNITVG